MSILSLMTGWLHSYRLKLNWVVLGPCWLRPVTNMSYLTMHPLAQNFIHNVSRSITSLWLSLLPACLPRPTCKLSGIRKLVLEGPWLRSWLRMWQIVWNCFVMSSTLTSQLMGTPLCSAGWGESLISDRYSSVINCNTNNNNNNDSNWRRTSLDRLIRLQIWEKIIIISTAEARSFQETEWISRLSSFPSVWWWWTRPAEQI